MPHEPLRKSTMHCTRKPPSQVQPTSRPQGNGPSQPKGRSNGNLATRQGQKKPIASPADKSATRQRAKSTQTADPTATYPHDKAKQTLASPIGKSTTRQWNKNNPPADPAANNPTKGRCRSHVNITTCHARNGCAATPCATSRSLCSTPTLPRFLGLADGLRSH
jgi:hypothetical protein